MINRPVHDSVLDGDFPGSVGAPRPGNSGPSRINQSPQRPHRAEARWDKAKPLELCRQLQPIRTAAALVASNPTQRQTVALVLS